MADKVFEAFIPMVVGLGACHLGATDQPGDGVRLESPAPSP